MAINLERLRCRALREQWSLDDLAWASIDFGGLPVGARAAGATALALEGS